MVKRDIVRPSTVVMGASSCVWFLWSVVMCCPLVACGRLEAMMTIVNNSTSILGTPRILTLVIPALIVSGVTPLTHSGTYTSIPQKCHDRNILYGVYIVLFFYGFTNSVIPYDWTIC